MTDILPMDQLLLILGMAAVTYIPRLLPLWLLSSREVPPAVMRWLEMVPPAVLAALLAPALFLNDNDSLFISMDNVFLLAAAPTLAIGWITKSFFGTVAVGMGSVALLRFWLPI